MEEVQILPYDLHRLKPGKVVIVIGRRGSGKSVLLNHVMYIMRHRFHSGVAMSPTSDTLRTFRQFMPGSFCYSDFNEDALKNAISSKQSYQEKIGSEDGDNYNIFVVMDDCMYNKKIMKSEPMRYLFMNGRHVKIFFMNLMQYCMDMGPDLRTNIDYVFAFQDSSLDNRFKLWKFFFGMFSKFEDFCRVMDVCTSGHECLVMDNTVKSNVITEKIYYFKASNELPRYRVGSKAWWYWDWRYGRQRSAHNAAKKIEKEVKDAYFSEHMDKDRLANPGLPKKDFMVIKAPKEPSVYRSRGDRGGRGSSAVIRAGGSAVRADIDGINLDAFETRDSALDAAMRRI